MCTAPMKLDVVTLAHLCRAGLVLRANQVPSESRGQRSATPCHVICNHPFHFCILEKLLSCGAYVPTALKQCEKPAVNLLSHLVHDITVVWGETADCLLPQLLLSVWVLEYVHALICVFWPPGSPVLCFVSPQGDVGPPGAEGEQGQEGIRVSDYKQPTNPFLPCVWVNLTGSFIYSPSFWQGCIIPQPKESRAMELFLSDGLYK